MYRLQRRNAKSTQSVQPQTFVASETEPVSHSALLCVAILCPALSYPVIWSVIFTSSIFSAPTEMSDEGLEFSTYDKKYARETLLKFIQLKTYIPVGK